MNALHPPPTRPHRPRTGGARASRLHHSSATRTICATTTQSRRCARTPGRCSTRPTRRSALLRRRAQLRTCRGVPRVWLAERRSRDVAVGSKWGYTYTAGWSIAADAHEVKDHTLPTLKRQWAESLAAIGPWLSLYQIHSATESSGVLDRADVLDELARLRDERCDRDRADSSGPDSRQTLERALAIERDGARLFTCRPGNLEYPRTIPYSTLASAHARDVRVIIKEALANGRLTARNDDRWRSLDTRSVLEREATRLVCTLDQLALAAALDQPWAYSVLSGAATVEQIASNVAPRRRPR